MGKSITLKQGFTIKLKGKAVKEISETTPSEIFAVKPSNYPIEKPKLAVKEGDEVLAGTHLFYDKNRPEILVCSPVSGEVVEIVRGEKRKVLEIKILADKELKFKKFETKDIRQALLESGLWSLLVQRPFNTIPDSTSNPRAIFVSMFNTAPLANEEELVIEHNKEALNKGLEILSELANGSLNVSFQGGQDSTWLDESIKLDKHEFSGPHPAGNVGIQIHHIAPIGVNDFVWTIDLQSLVLIGRLFLDFIYDARKIVGLVGPGVVDPQYYHARVGQQLNSILHNKILEDNQRIVQGDVLTGDKSDPSDFLSIKTDLITVLKEGNKPEFLGWLLNSKNKLSISHTFPAWRHPKKEYKLNTNMHGEERAFVMTGEYEKVLPMNIMPVQLLKAILAKDIEKMEQLGIYEVSREDFALCEFICTSKIDVQNIISEGLELIRKEG